MNTYRWGFRTLIDEATGIAWELYREDIESLEPGIKRGDFISEMSRTDFVKQFGSAFLEPGYFARFVGFLGNLVPNIGPLKNLPYKTLPDNVKQIFFHAYRDASNQYVKEISVVQGGTKVLVEGVNRVYKHVRRGHPKSPQGGRLSREMPIDISNVLLYCNSCGRGVRLRRHLSGNASAARRSLE